MKMNRRILLRTASVLISFSMLLSAGFSTQSYALEDQNSGTETIADELTAAANPEITAATENTDAADNTAAGENIVAADNTAASENTDAAGESGGEQGQEGTPAAADNSEKNNTQEEIPATADNSGEVNTQEEITVTEGQTEAGTQDADTEQVTAEHDEAQANAGENESDDLATGFEASRTVDGVEISVRADEGVFPSGATLQVTRVTDSAVEAAVDEERPADTNVVSTYIFDISILDETGAKLEPVTDNGSVSVTFAAEEAANENLDTDIYHVTEAEDETLSAEPLTAEQQDDGTVTAETDGFSYYVVEFSYGDLNYTLDGDGEVALSEIMDKVGLKGEVTEAVSSTESLAAVRGEDGSWKVKAVNPFDTEETLTLTIDGTPFVVKVTDDATGNAAKIGDTEYASVKAAFEAAADGDTITLLKDITNVNDLLGEAAGGKWNPITVANKSLTLDGDGKEIDRTADYLGTVFNVQAGAALTLENLTIDGKTDWSWSYELNYYTDKSKGQYGVNYFTVTVDDSTRIETASFINNAGTLDLNGVTARNLVSTCNGALISSTGTVSAGDSSFEKVLAYGNGGVIFTSGTSNMVELNNVTATDCGAGYGGNGKSGGFGYFNYTDLYVRDSTFNRVFATSNSGVMQLSNTTGVTVEDSVFDACVVGNDGGVTQVNNTDKSIDPRDFSFTGCKFLNMVGVAVGVQSLGYAVFVAQYTGYDKTPINFSNCLFENGISCEGAVSDWGYRDGFTYGCTMNFDKCTFTKNNTVALYQQSSIVTMTNCTVTENTTKSGSVSDMVVDDHTTLTLKNTVVKNNTAAYYGGAVYLYGSTSEKQIALTISSDCEVTDNHAGSYGGAIFATAGAYNVGRQITIEDGAKVYNNTAGLGGDDIAVIAGENWSAGLNITDAVSMNGKALADGKDINGWYYDNPDDRFVRFESEEYTDAVGKQADVSGKLYLKAELGDCYFIDFDKNAGDATGTTDSMQIKFDEEKNLTKNGFGRSGYTFNGWNTKADGTGTSYSNAQAVKNLTDQPGATVTLYARWTKNSDSEDTPSGHDPEDPTPTSSVTTTTTAVLGAVNAPAEAAAASVPETGVLGAVHDVPQTGDSSNAVLWVLLSLIAAGAAAGCAAMKRSRRR